MSDEVKTIEFLDECLERQVRILLARSAMYRLLSLALSYPTDECVQALRMGMDEIQTFLDVLEGHTIQVVGELDKSIRGLSREQLEEEYVRVFSHIFAPDAQPCETAYTAKNLFQLSDQLSRLTRFYEAFGVQPNRERPDHISVELHFMGYLAVREARALLQEDRERAEMCRNASCAFFQNHLKKYALMFGKAVREKGQGTYLFTVAVALEQWILAEARSLDTLEDSHTVPSRPLQTLRVLQKSQEVTS